MSFCVVSRFMSCKENVKMKLCWMHELNLPVDEPNRKSRNGEPKKNPNLLRYERRGPKPNALPLLNSQVISESSCMVTMITRPK